MSTDDQLIDLLEEFGAAFAAQDAERLRSLFDDDDVCFIASESLVLHDRAHVDRFIDGYAVQPVSLSFEWDACQVSSDDRAGWVSAFGREVRHDGDATTKAAFRITLVCNRRDDGWRIAHLHASTPD
jgi:uncharacterized protein (TIGR02246 family)